jgi:hypothetical protein
MKKITIRLALAFSLLTFVSCGETKKAEEKTEQKAENPPAKKEEEPKPKEAKEDENQDLAKKLIGKWKLIKIKGPKTDGTEGEEVKKASGYIHFEASKYKEQINQEGVQGEVLSNKWSLIKLPKEMMESDNSIMGIVLGETERVFEGGNEKVTMPPNYTIRSITDKELVLVPQGGEASIMSYFYEKEK